MFRGRFFHTLDTKGRVSVPSTFRTELERRSDRAPILTLLPHCLQLYPFEDWDAIERQLAAHSPIDQKAQAYARFVLSSAVEAPIDRAGRISIPQFQRKEAALEKEIAVIGVGSRIEIWNRERFEADQNTTRVHFDELSSQIAPIVGPIGKVSGGG